MSRTPGMIAPPLSKESERKIGEALKSSQEGVFTSPRDMGNGANFTHTFAKAGVYDYICTIHIGMVGTIAAHHVFLRGPAATVLFGNAMSFNGLAPEGDAEGLPVCAPGGLTTTQRFGRPSFVVAGESSTRSNPNASTKNQMASS